MCEVVGVHGEGLARYENLCVTHLGPIVMVERKVPHGFRQGIHQHADPYFTLVLSGRLTEFEDFGRQDYDSPCVSYQPPCEHSSGALGDTRLFVIGVRRGFIEGFGSYDYGRPYSVRGGALSELAHRVYAEFQSPDHFSALSVQGLVCEMIAASARRPSTGRKPPRWMNRIEELLRDPRSLTLTEVAYELGVHPVTLSREYRRHHRVTLGEARRRIKIQIAQELMRKTSIPLGEIALDAGFSDQSQFSKVFKQAVGVTPRQFRDAC